MKSDPELQRDVAAELAGEPSLDAGQVSVAAHAGIVTLTGCVGSYVEKWSAARTAQRVAGVDGVALALEVVLPAGSARSDEEIAQAASQVLQWLTLVPAGAIQVRVERAVVTLSGELDWAYQRRVAISTVRHLRGVIGVADEIAIHHPDQVAGAATVTDHLLIAC
jgi:osmotically-inducible protein OsmY